MASSGIYKDDETEVISEINVTPLVDVVLVLLVIFMVTAPIIAGRGISVNAPTTISGDSVATPLQVTLTKDGKLFVAGKPQASYETMKVTLDGERARDPDIKAIIAADAEVPHGEVMKAIDSVKRAKITKFALASKKPTEDGKN
ncbi:MAG TPA: biopolymer transporter ExbD [Kofleriaceae bacterium]|jgi:biopolymer transport protein ExbD